MEKQQPAATAAPAVPLRNGFVPRGNFAALPLAFPSVSTPIPADSSRVTALACRREPGACVFGATSGRETRVFLAGVRPPHGYVLELAVLPEAREATAVSLLPGGAPQAVVVITAANGPRGGLLARLEYEGRLADGIQEWSFQRPETETAATFPGERVLDLRAVAGRLLCLTERRLAWVEPGEWRVRDIVAVEAGIPRLGMLAGGGVLVAGAEELLLLDCERDRVRRLPPCEAAAEKGAWGWASAPGGSLLGADRQGNLFELDAEGTTKPRGRAPLAPVQVMACLPDGRAYGMCGQDLGRFFFVPAAGPVEDYGPVAAVLGTKRYAYDFACAEVGPDGEIYLGENDRGGHLWIYFPPVAP